MVASERVTVSAMNVGDCCWIRSSWNGMKKNPLRNVFTSSSCSASACDEEPKSPARQRRRRQQRERRARAR